jgi:hypothetical protein
VRLSREEKFWKDFRTTCFTEPGMEIDLRDDEESNTLLPVRFRIESHSNDTVERAMQLEKHFARRISTQARIQIALNAEHQEKALSSMIRRCEGELNMTFSRELNYASGETPDTKSLNISINVHMISPIKRENNRNPLHIKQKVVIKTEI